MDTEADLRARRQGKILLFLIVGAVSAILLWIGVEAVRENEPWGLAALTGSALFGWPLFRLGMYHARRRRQAGMPPQV